MEGASGSGPRQKPGQTAPGEGGGRQPAGYFGGTSFICSPQQISEWGMLGGQGHGFS